MSQRHRRVSGLQTYHPALAGADAFPYNPSLEPRTFKTALAYPGTFQFLFAMYPVGWCSPFTEEQVEAAGGGLDLSEAAVICASAVDNPSLTRYCRAVATSPSLLAISSRTGEASELTTPNEYCYQLRTRGIMGPMVVPRSPLFTQALVDIFDVFAYRGVRSPPSYPVNVLCWEEGEESLRKYSTRWIAPLLVAGENGAWEMPSVNGVHLVAGGGYEDDRLDHGRWLPMRLVLEGQAYESVPFTLWVHPTKADPTHQRGVLEPGGQRVRDAVTGALICALNEEVIDTCRLRLISADIADTKGDQSEPKPEPVVVVVVPAPVDSTQTSSGSTATASLSGSTDVRDATATTGSSTSPTSTSSSVAVPVSGTDSGAPTTSSLATDSSTRTSSTDSTSSPANAPST